MARLDSPTDHGPRSTSRCRQTRTYCASRRLTAPSRSTLTDPDPRESAQTGESPSASASAPGSDHRLGDPVVDLRRQHASFGSSACRRRARRPRVQLGVWHDALGTRPPWPRPGRLAARHHSSVRRAARSPSPDAGSRPTPRIPSSTREPERAPCAATRRSHTAAKTSRHDTPTVDLAT